MAKSAGKKLVQVGARMPEDLRDRLVHAAERHGASLNTEIVRRLEGTLEEDLLMRQLFRDKETYEIADLFTRFLYTTELSEGRRWSGPDARGLEGHEILLKAIRGFEKFIEAAPEILAGVPHIRGIGDLVALELLKRHLGYVRPPAMSRRGDAEETKP
jgi:hypothetical protein